MLAEVSNEPRRPRAHERFQVLPSRVRHTRFAIAWTFNLALYVFGCLAVLVYGAKFGSANLQALIEAWTAGLVFTWVLVEPFEIFGLVFLPKLFGGKGGKCRGRLKALGVYG